MWFRFSKSKAWMRGAKVMGMKFRWMFILHPLAALALPERSIVINPCVCVCVHGYHSQNSVYQPQITSAGKSFFRPV
jgi:hypothetical protein